MTSRRSLSRRKFIQAAAATAPLVIGSSKTAFAQVADPTPANDQITIAVIGVGKRGAEMLQSYFVKGNGFRTLAVCDVDTNRRNHWRQYVNRAYGNQDCAAYNDYREVLARDDVDAVVIATQDSWHATMIIDAAVAGKDIYSEKPLTLNLRESKDVVAAVRKYKCVLQTGSQQRTEFGHRFVTACEYVRSGRIGQLTHIHVAGCPRPPIACDLAGEAPEAGLDWDRWLGPAPYRDYNSILSPRGVHGHYPAWRNYREYGGGSLADMGAHHFDIAHWGMGADGTGPIKIVPPEDPASMKGAVAHYANGVKIIHGTDRNGTTFFGAEGKIYVDRGILESSPQGIFQTPLDSGDIRLPRPVNHAQDWAQAIRNRRDPSCPVEVGAGSAAVCHLMNLAYELRRELRWDAAAWRFVDDNEANGLLDYERRQGFELPKV